MSQKHEVLAWLKREPITQSQAWKGIGSMRLGARIYELRMMGYNIVTERVKVTNAKGEQVTVGRYRLMPKEQA